MNGQTHRTRGLTLIETTLVVATVALLIGLAVPAVRSMVNAFQSEGGTKGIIHATLSAARTMAVTQQRYVGVRFQKAYQYDGYTPAAKGLLDASQYMVFIVQEEPSKTGGLGNGFRAMEGHEAIKIPGTTGVMDLRIVTNRDDSTYQEIELGSSTGAGDVRIDEFGELMDATTFSIIFSPSGKLVTHWVQVRNRQGIPDTKARLANHSRDDIFNKKGDVDISSAALVSLGMGNELGLLYQDDYFGVLDTPAYPDGPAKPDFGLGPEYSRTSFVVYDSNQLQRAFLNGKAWSEYLSSLAANDAVYVSPYTGDLLSD